jgi:hypothetical protein
MLHKVASSKSAIRSARYRRRQRLGVQIIAIEIETWPVITALLDRKVISEESALNPARVACALAAIVADWAAKNRL